MLKGQARPRNGRQGEVHSKLGSVNGGLFVTVRANQPRRADGKKPAASLPMTTMEGAAGGGGLEEDIVAGRRAGRRAGSDDGSCKGATEGLTSLKSRTTSTVEATKYMASCVYTGVPPPANTEVLASLALRRYTPPHRARATATPKLV